MAPLTQTSPLSASQKAYLVITIICLKATLIGYQTISKDQLFIISRAPFIEFQGESPKKVVVGVRMVVSILGHNPRNLNNGMKLPKSGLA